MRPLAFTAVLLAAAPLSAAPPIRLAGHPALSPDGKTLAFDWAGDLWTVPSAGGTARPLTRHPAKDSKPFFSPDGQRVAFLSDRDGPTQVFVMPAAGGDATPVTFHTSGFNLLGWHPDGARVVVSAVRDHGWTTRNAERTFLVNVDRRAGEELIFDDYGREASVSPDGKKVLFTREGVDWARKGYHGSQAGQIWQFDRDEAKFRKLLGDEYGAVSPVWKPDGSGFYYCAGKTHFDLHEYDAETGRSRRLTEFADDHVVQPCVSRDGETVAFRHLFDLYVLHPGNGGPKKLAITPADDRRPEPTDRRALTRASDAAFTNDGLEIALIAGGDLWVMDTELKEPIAVTKSAEFEAEPVFAPDGNTLYFLSDIGGKSDVHKATRADAGKFWWQNGTFNVERVTTDGAAKANLSLSPDGKKLAYVRDRGDLVVSDADGKNAKVAVKSFSRVDYDWSPDGKWICYAAEDESQNRDVYLAPLDGSRPPFNVSRHPYNDYNPRWSPDGKCVAFTGQRENKEQTDVHFVWLRAEEAEKGARERAIAKAVEKMKGRGAAPAPRKLEPKEGEKPADGDDPAKKDDDKEKEKPAAAFKRGPAPVPDVVIDFDGILDRVKRVTIADSSESGLFWSPDGKKLAFAATVDGQRGTFTVEPADDLKPKRLSSQTGSGAKWLKSGTSVVWLANGLPASVAASAGRSAATAAPAAPTVPSPFLRRGSPSPSPSPTPAPAGGSEPSGDAGYAFTALQEVNLSQRNAAAFDLAWRTMRDNWYDDKLGNRDWNAVRAKYIDAAAAAPDLETLAVVVNLMLGELNGSHLGFYPSGSERARRAAGGPTTEPAAEPTRSWTPVTAHLGVRFVDGFAGPGLKVRDVLPNGPAERTTSRIKPGETILKIDGKPVSPADDLTKFLNGPLARDIALTVAGADGKERVVTLRPITVTAARELMYEAWLRRNRTAVERQSGGTLGYLHIEGMNFPSFHKFIEQLHAAGYGKAGLVIDVRENGGGSTADHLLTALSQPRHAIAVPRGGSPGYPQDRTIYATWDKPIVVLCNQNSFSNAEIFSHAIKTLGRGKLVGVQTAGGVVSTGAATIMDAGTLRLPTRGWYVISTGEDMELNGAAPDVVLWPEPGAMPKGDDAQLAKAVEVLLADVKADAAKAKPKLRKATER